MDNRRFCLCIVNLDQLVVNNREGLIHFKTFVEEECQSMTLIMTLCNPLVSDYMAIDKINDFIMVTKLNPLEAVQ